MKQKAFTMMEILVALVVLAILVTLAVPVYQNVLEDAKARACETNLQVIKTAVEIYAMEHDALPGSLGELPAEYLGQAYARVMQGKDAWIRKLAYFLVDWEKRGLAYAQSSMTLQELMRGNLKVITCPSDSTPPPGGYSYAFNKALESSSKKALKSINVNRILISDSDSKNFNKLSVLANARHKKFSLSTVQASYAQGITIDNRILTVDKEHVVREKKNNRIIDNPGDPVDAPDYP